MFEIHELRERVGREANAEDLSFGSPTRVVHALAAGAG